MPNLATFQPQLPLQQQQQQQQHLEELHRVEHVGTPCTLPSTPGTPVTSRSSTFISRKRTKKAMEKVRDVVPQLPPLPNLAAFQQPPTAETPQPVVLAEPHQQPQVPLQQQQHFEEFQSVPFGRSTPSTPVMGRSTPSTPVTGRSTPSTPITSVASHNERPVTPPPLNAENSSIGPEVRTLCFDYLCYNIT